MEDRIGFADVLQRMGCRLPAGRLRYFGHWITPRSYPRRFDTRFFAADVHRETEPTVDEREMTEALWVSPAAALRRHAVGELPMIRPTLWALEKLSSCGGSAEALRALAAGPIRTVLPET
jgi:recombination protein RecT